MGRVLITVLVLAGAVAAAPPPKESAENKLHRLFGTPFDPVKDCTFTLDGSQLKIKIPGSPHRFTPGYESDSSVAPRARQEWVGDFDVRVKVMSITPPGSKTDGSAMTAAGLFLAGEGNTFVTLSKYTTKNDTGDGTAPQFLFQHYLTDGNGSGSGLNEIPTEQRDRPVYLRLVREKNKVTGHSSPDGKTWTPRGTNQFGWPEKVSIGVFASHGVDHAVEAVFEEFRVTKPEKEPTK